MPSTRLCLIFIVLVGAFLRLYHLTVSPPSLYIDEADAGYQAFSILKTGKDYFGNFLPVHLHSFADRRTPLYIYALTPFVAFLGLSEISVRLPSALFGILTIPIMYWTTTRLFAQYSKKEKEFLGLSSALIVAVLPWHIHYSRVGFEVTLLLLVLTLATGWFVQWEITKKSSYLYLSLSMFLISPYIYSTAKLFVPLLLVFLFIRNRKSIIYTNYKSKVVIVLLIILISLPMVVDIFLGPGRNRFSILSVFNDRNSMSTYLHYGWLSTFASPYQPLGFAHPYSISKFVLSRPVQLAYEIASSYFSTLSSNFLIFSGDPNPRHNIPESGEAGLAITLFFVIGIVYTLKNYRDSNNKLLLALLILSPIPSSITIEGTYHATRLFILILPLAIISAQGILFLIKREKKVLLFLLLLLFCEINRDQFIRFGVYPLSSYKSWDGGWGENIQTLSQLSKYDYIVVDNSTGAPLQTFFAFYSRIDPKTFQKYTQTTSSSPKLTKYGLKNTQYFPGNIYFANLEPSLLNQNIDTKVLGIISYPKDPKSFSNIDIVSQTRDPLNNPSFYFITNKYVSTDTTYVPKTKI